MAKRKTTELTTITASALADGDWFPVVDVSDTTDSSTGTNKKIAKSQLAEAAGVTAHLADTSDAHDASAISFSATGNIVATDVQAAIAELDSEKAAVAEPIAAAHIADTSAAHAASAVSFSATGSISSTDVQAAIAEVDSDLTAHTGDTSDAHDASAISVLDTAGNYTATDVEAVLAELPSRFAPLAALYFPGSSGNYVRTPDTATLDITGDITTVELIAAADWTPAATQYTLGKWEGSANHSYAQGIQNTTGCLQFIVSGNGSEAVTATSSVAPTITDGNLLWIKRDWRASDGRTRFYTATYDGTRSIPTSWTQLGSNQTAAATGSALYSGAGVLEIGGLEGSGSLRFVGRIGRSTVYSGIDGAATVVADFNPVVPASQFRDSTGKIWTVTGASMGWESGPFS